MYKQNKIQRTSISINESDEGATIEHKIERIINNKEPITDGAPIIYTERNEGVLAAYNIRSDRFEIALDGIDKIQKSYQARSENKAKMEVIRNEKDSGAESTGGNNANTGNQ